MKKKPWNQVDLKLNWNSKLLKIEQINEFKTFLMNLKRLCNWNLDLYVYILYFWQKIEGLNKNAKWTSVHGWKKDKRWNDPKVQDFKWTCQSLLRQSGQNEVKRWKAAHNDTDKAVNAQPVNEFKIQFYDERLATSKDSTNTLYGYNSTWPYY